MSVAKIDKGELTSELKVVIEQSQYESKYNEELKKYRQKAQMKGFRKGKVPLSVVRKLYGRALLADVVNECVQSEMATYFEEEKLETLGQPIPAESQQPIDFELKTKGDFEFNFDIGLAPHVELKGLDDTSSFTMWSVTVPEDMIDEQMADLRKRAGERALVEDSIEEEDVLTFNAWELADGKRKVKGLETTFKIAMDLIEPLDIAAKLLASKQGDTIRFDIFKLEKDRDEDFVRKHLLQLDEDDLDREVGNDFEAEIIEVSRLQPAELNQAFFDKVFGPDKVSSEEEARGEIQDQIKSQYNRQAEALLYRDFQDRLMEMHSIDLPDAFLKRWLVISSEENTKETVDAGYEAFARGLRWNLIETQIQKKYELEVDQSDVRDAIKQQILGYMQGYPLGDEVLDSLVDRSMADEKQVRNAYQEKMGDLIFEKIRDLVTIVEEDVTVDELQEKMAEAQRTMSSGEEE
ncbi:MAG: hypothetical protein KTR24_00210 [Saprospiraceae bacterium]|nr:hypothetical protein [Saprospiraceae bacterium]